MPERMTSIAKITRPRIRGVFPRERLFGLLDETRQYPVTWISAPAGSGKTTLVASYLEANRIPCLWYQVDEGDADIATFFNYLGVAAKKAAPKKRKPLPLLTPEYLQGISTFTLRYFENLFSWLKPPSILVLDNYQTVAAESDFHAVINNGISTIPDGINAFIISRHDLPPPLSGLRANGLMKMLGWGDLRLTLEETIGIVPLKVREISSKDIISKDIIGQLHQATDGWVAGLVLMLESMKRGVEPHLLRKMAPEEIIDYFGNEFFNKTDQEIQNFLLKTSFLPKITLKAAEQLTGLSNADRILSALSRNNYFTERHYSTEPIYQYHLLYREFLMTRARETFPREALSSLLHQAAQVLERDGQLEAAIFLFRDLDDWCDMVPLILQYAPLMIEQGRYHPLGEWLDSLPKNLVENDPWLLYWKGASISIIDSSLAHPYFEQAFEKFMVQSDQIGSLLAWSGVVYSIIYSFEEYFVLDRWIQLFPGLPENPERVIPTEVWNQVVSSMFTALSYRSPEHAETEAWIRRAESIVQNPGIFVVKAQILLQLVHYYGVVGDYEKATQKVRSLQHLAQSKETPPVVVIMTSMAEAMHYGLTGDDKKCIEAVTEGIRLSENTGIFFLAFVIMAHGIANYQNVGNLEMAQTMLEKIASSWNDLRPFDKGLYHLVQSRQLLLRSEFDAASDQVELALERTLNVGAYDPIGLAHLLAAQIRHSTGKQTEAWDHLHEAFLVAEKIKSKIFEYYGLMIESHFYFEQGDEISGLASLKKALALGKGKGFLNTFIDQPAVTANLCIKALEENIEVPYVLDIIRKRKLISEKPPLHLENWPWSLKIFTLGHFAILKDGLPVQFSRKVQQKPLTMLKALVAFGGKEVREEQIADILWPDADGDTAHMSFITTLHRLRRLLGNEKAIQYREGRVTLDERYCWLDIWAFEHLLGQVAAKRKEGLSDKAVQLAAKAIEIYKGSFLAGEPERPWAVSMQERLKSKFIRSVNQIARYWGTAEKWENAMDCYQRALEVDDKIEELYQNLMICHQRLGQRTEGIAVYNRCRKTLSATLGINPSSKTQTIYRSLLSE